MLERHKFTSQYEGFADDVKSSSSIAALLYRIIGNKDWKLSQWSRDKSPAKMTTYKFTMEFLPAPSFSLSCAVGMLCSFYKKKCKHSPSPWVFRINIEFFFFLMCHVDSSPLPDDSGRIDAHTSSMEPKWRDKQWIAVPSESIHSTCCRHKRQTILEHCWALFSTFSIKI